MIKKILASFVMSIFAVGAITFAANAAVTENSGNGIVITRDASDFTNISKNVSNTANASGTNKNWTNVSQATLSGDDFNSAVRVISSGTTEIPSTNQIRLTTNFPTMSSGGYVYLSFYYRLNSCSVETNLMPGFSVQPIGTSSGTLTDIYGDKYQFIDGLGKWKRCIYIIKLSSDYDAANRYIQLSWTRPTELGYLPEYSADFAGFDIVYLGIPSESTETGRYETVQEFLSDKGYYCDRARDTEEYAKYGIYLTGDFYKKSKILYNTDSVKSGIVKETELKKWLSSELPEIKANGILNGNYAFVADSKSYYNVNRKETASIEAVMTSTGDILIDSQVSDRLFGYSSGEVRTSVEAVADQTGLKIFKDRRGIAILGNDLSAIDTSLTDSTVNAYYRSFYDVAYCIGTVTWDDVYPTAAQYAEYRQKMLKAMLVPDGKWDAYSDFVSDSISEANSALEYMDYSDGALSPFTDITIPDIDSSHSHQQALEAVYRRIKQMAVGYKLSVITNSNVANKAALKTAVLYSMELMNKKYYSSNDYLIGGTPRFTTFKHTLPINISDILLCMYDDMDAATRQKYIDEVLGKAIIPDMIQGSYDTKQTYANYIWSVIPYIHLAVLTDDTDRLNHACRYMAAMFDYTKRGEVNPMPMEGFFEDGSFVFHNGIAYNMGYGKGYLIALSELTLLSKDTLFDVSNVYGYDRIYHIMYNSYLPFVNNYKKMKIVAGRETPESNARNIMAAIILLANDAPEQYKAELASKIKPYITNYIKNNLTEHVYVSNFTFASYPNIVEKINDYFAYIDGVESKTDGNYNKIYYNMDRAIHKRDNFIFGLAMSSERIGKYESSSDTYTHSLVEWYIGDGMTYTYSGDSLNLSTTWWNNINPYYMPGTTVDSTVRNENLATFSMNDSIWGKPENSWAGGVSDGSSGAAGMILGNRWVSGLEGKKSYFMFDNEVVCMGSGISGGEGEVYTVVDNRIISKAGSGSPSVGYNDVYYNGTKLPVSFDTKSNLGTPSWMWLDNNGTGSMGYIFDGKTQMQAERATDTGGGYVYLELTARHGSKPSNESYAYTILPNKTKVETEAYAAAPDVEIVEHTNSIHAVYCNSKSTYAANIFSASSLDGISFVDPCAVMIEKNDNGGTIYVSDPTMKLDEINIHFARKVKVTGENITVSGAKVAVAVNEFYGKTYSFTYEYMTGLDIADLDGVSRVYKNVSNTANANGTDKSWLTVDTVSLENDIFNDAVRITSSGTTAVPSTNQVRVECYTPSCGIGDYAYFSFYYRVNSEIDDVQYNGTPPKFSVMNFNKNSGTIKNTANIVYNDCSEFDKWKKVTYIAPITDSIDGNMYIQLSWVKPNESLPEYCIDIAGMRMKLFTDEELAGAESIYGYITDAMSVSGLRFVYINDEKVDISESDYYEYGGDINKIYAVNLYENFSVDTAAVEYDGGTKYIITAYAPDFDFTDSNDKRKTVYTVYSGEAPLFDNIVFDKNDDGTISVNADYTGNTHFEALLAAYDADERIERVERFKATKAVSDKYYYPLALSINGEDSSIFKLMLWNNLNDITPIFSVQSYRTE